MHIVESFQLACRVVLASLHHFAQLACHVVLTSNSMHILSKKLCVVHVRTLLKVKMWKHLKEHPPCSLADL